MQTVSVALGPSADRTYAVRIGPALLETVGAAVREVLPKVTHIALITDRTVDRIYGDRVAAALTAAGLPVHRAVVRPGEPSKSVRQADQLWGELIAAGADRRWAVVALGGGVIGDLAGFVAATLLRGLPLVQVPTTLLAQVDSSVGGKVGVNHKLGKNLIGAFHQPRLVLADTDTLATLPRREITAGLGEVVKYGFIGDRPFLDDLSATLPELRSQPDSARWPQIVAHSVRAKAAVVQADEHETGVRATLNFGHTVGHALEAVTRYKRFKHGEAVLIGMRAALDLSCGTGHLPETERDRGFELLDRLPVGPTVADLSLDETLAATGHDKKAEGGQARFVLLDGALGQATLPTAVDPDLVRDALRRLGLR